MSMGVCSEELTYLQKALEMPSLEEASLFAWRIWTLDSLKNVICDGNLGCSLSVLRSRGTGD